jgi:hydroxymethylpyrimidine pyrophosphatase-like HAD family hydrolase
MKWMIAFDLDGTLAESKRPLSEDMAATSLDCSPSRMWR